MEQEIFSAKVQVRKSGEIRYGKGTIKITDRNVYLDYKKFLSKRQTITIPRNHIAKVEFKDVEAPFEMIAPIRQKFSWVIFVITLKDGTGFEFFVGEVARMKPKDREKYVGKYEKILKILQEGSVG
jgi:hypothetical protein